MSEIFVHTATETVLFLQEIVGIAGLIADGLGLIANTKAAIVRLGLCEIKAFVPLVTGEPSTYSVAHIPQVLASGWPLASAVELLWPCSVPAHT